MKVFVALSFALGMAGAAHAATTTVYGINNDKLYTITDFTTWTTNLVGYTSPLGGASAAGGITLSDIGINSTGTTMFGIDLSGGPALASEFYSVDPGTGATTAIGSTGVLYLNGLVLSAGATPIAYASDYGNGNIYTINLSTGLATQLNVGNNKALSSEGDLEFVGSTLYLTGLAFGHDYLYTVNTTTGAVTAVNSSNGICTGAGNTGTCYTQVFGLADVNGTLYGFVNSATPEVLQLDTTTGLVTATFSYSPSFNGTAEFSSAVPEPGVLSTSLLGLAAGAFILRKRRAFNLFQ